MKLQLEVPAAIFDLLARGGRNANDAARDALFVGLYRRGDLTQAQLVEFHGLDVASVNRLVNSRGVFPSTAMLANLEGKPKAAMPSAAIEDALTQVARFRGADLTETISGIERKLRGLTLRDAPSLLDELHATQGAFHAAALLKLLAGQVDVVVHALGILLCLPRILEDGERIEAASLGAGTGGKRFDLETDRRIAEFKFISWRGGAEAVRQNGLFKDFCLLAEEPTSKGKFLYVIDSQVPLRFLNGRRAIDSVLKSWPDLRETLAAKYGMNVRRVCEYFGMHARNVSIENIADILGAGVESVLEDAEANSGGEGL